MLVYNKDMQFDFSITNNPAFTELVALRTVYTVNADPTYDVKKTGVLNNDLIALRTVGGRGSVIIENLDELSVTEGTLLFFEHKKVRRYYCSDSSWDFWWFEFASSWGSNLPMNRVLYVNSFHNEAEHCSECLDLLRKSDISSLSLASAVLEVLIYRWLLNIEHESNNNPYLPLVEKVIAYIKSNMSDRICISELARMAGLGERRFRQVFQHITGMPPKKYLDNLRFGMAAELLNNTSFSIADISEKLGYSSQFHFSRTFKKAAGVSPYYFRKERRNLTLS